MILGRTLLLFLITTLLGCSSTTFLAGAATSGVIIYDRRSIQMIATDQKIIFKSRSLLENNKELRDRTHVDITSFNRMVLLTGQAPSAELRNRVFTLVSSVPKVKKIHNYIKVGGPSSQLTRSSDTWITTKIKSKMLATEHLHSSQIKVLTENGHVYLLGKVSTTQANLAVNIARRVAGVQEVIKLFVYDNS